MNAKDLKKSGIIAVALTIVLMGFWFVFSKISLGIDYNPTLWTKYNLKKDSVIDSRIIILCGTDGAKIIFGSTTGAWVGTPTDSTLPTIGLNTSTGKLEVKHAGTETASPIVKYHDDLSGITANQHHNQVHGAADHSGNIGAESQITFGTETGHAHTGTDSTKISYSNLLNRSHGAADHSGNIGTESQITFGTETGHAHTGTDSTKISYPNLLNRTHGAADHSGNIGTESQITFGTQSGHTHNGSDSTKIDYTTAPVKIGTDTTGNTDNISEGSTNKYYTDARVNAAIGSSSIGDLSDVYTISEGDFLKKVGGVIVGGSNTVTVAWGDIYTGSPTANSDITATTGTSSAGKIALLNVNGQFPNERLSNFSTGTITQVSQGYLPGNSNAVFSFNANNPGTTLFIDHSQYAGTITATASAIGTTTAKYGSGAALIPDGSSVTVADADYLDIGANTPFKIAGWWSILTNKDNVFIDKGEGNAADTFRLEYRTFIPDINFQSPGSALSSGTFAPSTNTFYYYEVNRDGSNTVRLFIGGILKGSTTASGTISVNNSNLKMGVLALNGGANLNGYADDVEILVGTSGGHHSDYTLPTELDFGTVTATYIDNIYNLISVQTLETTTGRATTASPSFVRINATTTVFGSSSSANTGMAAETIGDSYISGKQVIGTTTPPSGTYKQFVSMPDNGVGIIIQSEASSANFTTADVAISIRDKNGNELGSIAGTAVDGLTGFNTGSVLHGALIEGDKTGLRPLDVLEISKGGNLKEWKCNKTEMKEIQEDELDIAGNPVMEEYGSGTVKLTRIKQVITLKEVTTSTAMNVASKPQLVYLQRCTTRKSPNTVGLYAGTDSYGRDMYFGLGTAVCRVINLGENLKPNDYLISSDFPGYLEKQPDIWLPDEKGILQPHRIPEDHSVVRISEEIIWGPGEQDRIVACRVIGG